MKRFLEFLGEIANDPCWFGYKMVGKKKKGGKEVPNCVPEEVSVRDAAGELVKVKNVAIRMADGTIKRLPPGKSGSSGGGGNGA